MPTGRQPTVRPTGWTFLTNHGHVIVVLSRFPDSRVRDIAATVGITERATQAILADLERDGYLTRTREGRRNRYELHVEQPLRHPAEADHDIGELVRLFGDTVAS
jgi:DNA-binding IclR family transcriptional regulator